MLEHHPGKLRHVLSLVQTARGGKDYVARFGERMTGEGPYAELVAQRFKLATERLGLNRQRLRLRNDLFERPQRVGDQMNLFRWPSLFYRPPPLISRMKQRSSRAVSVI